jgi:predicted amidohydrolase
MSDILNLLRPGDVLTHCYSGAPNIAGAFTNIVQDGKLLPAALGRAVLKPVQTVINGVPFGRPYQSPFAVR